MTNPAPTDDVSAGVGAITFEGPPASTPGRDLLRILSCALLVAMSVASLSVALLVAPFIPVLVGLRLVRRDPSMRFLVSCTAAALVAAVLAAPRDSALAPALVAALSLVPMLGIVHARAARWDPVDSIEPQSWPEPRLATGFSLATGGWVLGTVVLVLVLVSAIGSVTLMHEAREFITEAYKPYVRACSDSGALARQRDLCERLLEQRDDVLRVVSSHPAELLGALAAAFAFSCAAIAHVLVLTRARKRGERVRLGWRFAELEVHWAFAYVAAAGFAGLLLASSVSVGGDVIRACAFGAAVLGSLGVMAQGAGLIAWYVARAPRRNVLWGVLAITLLFASPVIVVACAASGMFDMAIHPRRRALLPPT